MKQADISIQSKLAQRSFDVSVYGDAGRAVIAFPSEDGCSTSWENGGMVEALRERIEAGELQLFCTESMDAQTWLARGAVDDYRLRNLEQWQGYVEKELLPYAARHSASKELPLVAGASIGALNATALMLRQPKRLGGLLAMSGSYDARAFAGADPDQAWLDVSPVDIVRTLANDAKGMKGLAGKQLAFVCGRSSDELGLGSQRGLDALCCELGLEASFEYWGWDVVPSWFWWQEEARQLLPCLLAPNGLIDRKLVARLASARTEAEHAADQSEAAAVELREASEALKQAKSELRAARKRTRDEAESVEAAAQKDEELSVAAAEAWAERDRIALLLAEATKAAGAAQSAADAAAERLGSARWIAGEAEAAVERASQAQADATARLASAKEAVAAAQGEAERLAAALAEVQAEVDAERDEARRLKSGKTSRSKSKRS